MNIKITPDLKVEYHMLNEGVDLDFQFTLRDVMGIPFRSGIPLGVWAEILQCDCMEEYWEECQRQGKPSEMEFLELSLHFDKMTFRMNSSSQCWWDFHGVGRLKEDEDFPGGKKAGEWQSYAIEFTPVCDMAGLPVRVKPMVTFDDLDDRKGRRHEVHYRPSMSLMELVCEVWSEISFCGSPPERDEKLNDLKQQVEDVKSGKVELTVVDLPDLEETRSFTSPHKEPTGKGDENAAGD